MNLTTFWGFHLMFSIFLFSRYVPFESSPGMLLLMMKFLLGHKTTSSLLVSGYCNKKRKSKENSSLTTTKSFTVKWCESMGMREKVFIKNVISVRLQCYLYYLSIINV